MPSITRKAKISLNRNKSLKKNKSPSISILKERSIQLQKDEPSILNKFTTKNVTVRDKNQNVWNTVENRNKAARTLRRLIKKTGIVIGNDKFSKYFKSNK